MADDNYDPDRLQSERPSGTPVTRVRPQKLSRDDAEKLVTKYNPDITKAAVAGEVDNIMRESGGNAANKTGDGGTSGGLYQHHLGRLTGLKEFAAKEKADWTDPDIQVRYSRLEKERDYPALLKLQQTNDDRGRNEDAFKRIFERPASVLWGNDASGQPVLGNDKYRFSDYAMKEHDGRKNTDMLMMSPAEYLDLSPELSPKPFENPAGRALKKSFDKGDAIESVPTLDVNVDGPTATVTDQDGRHRALLAQQNGIEAIPVAVRRTGEGEPKEIVGLNGVPMAHDFPKASDVQGRQAQQPTPEQPTEPIPLQAKPEERSLLGRVANAIIPSAGAAEADNPYAHIPVPGAAPTQGAADNPYAHIAVPGGDQRQAEQPHDSMVTSIVKGAAKGLGDTVLSGQELVGEGMKAVGIPGGQWLTEDARKGMAGLKQEIAPDQAAHPFMTGAGDVLGGMIVPGGAASKLIAPANALRAGAVSGALAGLLSPGDSGNYWGSKALATGAGAGAGAAAGKGGNMLAGMVAPSLRQTVAKLMSEGVQLTPGQMAGGVARTLEDKAMSIPITGDAIAAARRRGYEQFNRAAWNRALEPLGETMPDTVKMGRDASDYVGDRLSAAYGRILPRLRLTSVQNDPIFVADLDSIVNAARSALPEGEFYQLEKLAREQILGKLGTAGTSMDGELINGIDSMLGSEVRGYKGDPTHDKRKLGQAIEELQIAFRDLLERQNPREAAALRATREGYANYVRVAKAAASTGTATNEGIFSPAQLNAAVRSEDRTTRKLGYSKGRALLQDLSDAGQAVLPSKYPDSGTAGRLMLGGGALGVAELLHHPEAILGLLAGAAPYTPPASKAMNMALGRLAQPAGPTRNALADLLRNSGRLAAPAAGAAGAAVAPGAISTGAAIMQPTGSQ